MHSSVMRQSHKKTTSSCLINIVASFESNIGCVGSLDQLTYSLQQGLIDFVVPGHQQLPRGSYSANMKIRCAKNEFRSNTSAVDQYS